MAKQIPPEFKPVVDLFEGILRATVDGAVQAGTEALRGKVKEVAADLEERIDRVQKKARKGAKKKNAGIIDVEARVVGERRH